MLEDVENIYVRMSFDHAPSRIDTRELLLLSMVPITPL